MSDFKLPDLNDINETKNQETSKGAGLPSLSVFDTSQESKVIKENNINNPDGEIIELDWEELDNVEENFIDDIDPMLEMIPPEILEEIEEPVSNQDNKEEDFSADEKVSQFLDNLKSKLPKFKFGKYIKTIIKVGVGLIILAIVILFAINMMSGNSLNKFKPTEVSNGDTKLLVTEVKRENGLNITLENSSDISADFTMEVELKRSFLPIFDNNPIICTSDITVLEIDEGKQLPLNCKADLEGKDYSIKFTVINTP